MYIVRFEGYDLQFHADRVDLGEFLAESARQEAALRAGRLIAGVAAVPAAFGR